MDGRKTGARWILLGIVALILAAGVGYLVMPNRLCPKCKGFTIAHNERTLKGLPDHSGLVPCTRCVGRGSVTTISLWIRGESEGDIFRDR